ncbi:MAG: nucleotidyltransferase domain-containing protein [Candidatus Latescibacterota bacterium]|jgi:hypothetical protein
MTGAVGHAEDARASTTTDLEQRVGSLLGAFPGIMAVYLFGSMADGTAQPESDLDLAVVPADDTVRTQKLEMLTALARAGFANVDLVFLDGRDAVLRFHAVRRNRPINLAPGFDHPGYFSRALREYFDLEPLLRVRHRAYRERMLSG